MGGELALHQVWAALDVRVGLGGAPRLAAALGALNPVRAHQALHLGARDPLAGPEQRLPGASIPIGLVEPVRIDPRLRRRGPRGPDG